LPAAEVEDVAVVPLEMPPLAVARGAGEHDNVVVAGQHVVDIDPEGPVGPGGDLTEGLEDAANPLAGPGHPVPAVRVPLDVRREQLLERSHVPSRAGLVPASSGDRVL